MGGVACAGFLQLGLRPECKGGTGCIKNQINPRLCALV